MIEKSKEYQQKTGSLNISDLTLTMNVYVVINAQKRLRNWRYS